jgi:carboxymethylenebutenolidase
MSQTITIATSAGTFGAYLARPEAPVAPAIVVLHEVFGVNADMRETCDELARQGFLAICPDLFWRQSPGVDLGVTSEADWNTGLALYLAYDRDKGVGDIADAVRTASQIAGASGKVGVLGYCLGGLMAFLTAARSKVDATVAFHGADTEKYLDEVAAITIPLLMHLAEADEFISPQAQSAIIAACAQRPNITIYSYPGCHHAFSRHGGAHYDAGAAAIANTRTWSFLKSRLI